MSKKAILTVELAYESAQETNNQIVNDISRDSQIPWCSKIRKVEVYDQ